MLLSCISFSKSVRSHLQRINDLVVEGVDTSRPGYVQFTSYRKFIPFAEALLFLQNLQSRTTLAYFHSKIPAVLYGLLLTRPERFINLEAQKPRTLET